MLLFNQTAYALGDSVSNFNTSNVTIQRNINKIRTSFA